MRGKLHRSQRNIGSYCEKRPFISQCQFCKAATVPRGTVHHGNAIISSGSPLHEFAQWHKPADRATRRWGKCRNTQTRKSGEVCAFLLSEGCAVPPSGRRPPLQPHGPRSLNSSLVSRNVNCSILMFQYLTAETALRWIRKSCLHLHQPGWFPVVRQISYISQMLISTPEMDSAFFLILHFLLTSFYFNPLVAKHFDFLQ